MTNYSVIIPYKDRPTLLMKALNSIPDRKDIQIIVVNNNDCPLDGRVDLSRRESRLLLLDHPGGGPGGARNEGLNYAEGLYTIFCDADDYFTDDAFDSFDNCIGEDKDIVFFRVNSVNLDTNRQGSRHLCYIKLISNYFKTGNENTLRYGWGSAWGKIYKTAMLKQNGIRFGEGAGGDILFSAIAGYYAAKLDVKEESIYVITSRGNEPSFSESFKWRDWLRKFQAYGEKRRFLYSVGYGKFAESPFKIAVRLLRSGFNQCVCFRLSRLRQGLDGFRISDVFRPFKHKFDKYFFEVHIADHCNLDCASCSHFSPLAEPCFCSFNNFSKDIARMKSIFPGNEVRRIRLLGGEPLLNPEICDFIRCTYETFPDAERSIVTNGILLKQQKDEFWQTVKSTGTSIYVSRYPISLDYVDLASFLQQKNVLYFIEKDSKNCFRKDALDRDATTNPWKNWLHCTLAVRCSQLRDGRLYMCCKPAYVNILNTAFSAGFDVTEKDYVDIYREDARKAINKYLSKPIPFCRYCKMTRKTFVKWQKSEHKIKEWQ